MEWLAMTNTATLFCSLEGNIISSDRRSMREWCEDAFGWLPSTFYICSWPKWLRMNRLIVTSCQENQTHRDPKYEKEWTEGNWLSRKDRWNCTKIPYIVVDSVILPLLEVGYLWICIEFQPGACTTLPPCHWQMRDTNYEENSVINIHAIKELWKCSTIPHWLLPSMTSHLETTIRFAFDNFLHTRTLF